MRRSISSACNRPMFQCRGTSRSLLMEVIAASRTATPEARASLRRRVLVIRFMNTPWSFVQMTRTIVDLRGAQYPALYRDEDEVTASRSVKPTSAPLDFSNTASRSTT